MHISFQGIHSGAKLWCCVEMPGASSHRLHTSLYSYQQRKHLFGQFCTPEESWYSGFQASACFSNCALGPRCVPGLLSVDGRWKASAHALELPRSALQVSSCFGTPLKIISCFSLWVLLRTQITLLVWNLIWLTICIFLSLCFPLGIWTSLKFI